MHCCGVEDLSLIWEEVIQLGIKNWGNKALKGLVADWFLVQWFIIYGELEMKLSILAIPILKNRLSRRSFGK
jgi:hypothetical protein